MKLTKLIKLSTTHAAICLIILGCIPALANAQLAVQYPNDIGIENDPDVLYVEKFDDGLPAIFSRYDEKVNTAGMSLDSDVPPGSMEPYSIRMTNVGGENNGGHLYKRFVPGFDSTVYLRYYVKYPSISKGYIHHEGVWIGGYNPSTPWPNPRAGTCGLGDARISIAYEPVGTQTMNTYMYWGDMRHDPNGNCWGNVMILGDSVASPVPYDNWLCVEIMVKLNDPVTSYNGELRIWHDGKEVGYWGPGFPNGFWTWDKFITRDTASPYEGFRWRTDPDLNLNYIWIEYYDDTSPDGVSHYIKYDHIVIAKKRIGPLYDAAAVRRGNRSSVVQIYPNPATNELTVRAETSATITFFNLLGESIYHVTTHGGETKLDAAAIPQGMYTIRIATPDDIFYKKFIRQ
jgi:hypothetical protein